MGTNRASNCEKLAREPETPPNYVLDAGRWDAARSLAPSFDPPLSRSRCSGKMGPLLREITGANFSEGLCTVRGSPADWGKTSARFQSGQIGAVGSVLFHHFTGISTPPEER